MGTVRFDWSTASAPRDWKERPEGFSGGHVVNRAAAISVIVLVRDPGRGGGEIP